mmetsp:Transcript_43860/g.138848  ORF Transcript_43860/g.138848 Transcript_43860/m.138848 type:complete len:590 (-) Transcript_43860:160-1929(-)
MCPVSVSFSVPDARSQTLIVRSAEPVAYHWLVGSTATQRTQPRWPEMTRISFHGACHSGFGRSCLASRRRGTSRVLPGGTALLPPLLLGATTAPPALLPAPGPVSISFPLPAAPPDAPPAAVTDALNKIGTAFGLSSGKLARADNPETRALAVGWGAALLRECIASPPPTLSELLARLEAVRAGLATELAAAPRVARVDGGAWRMLLSQQPLVEVPGQYEAGLEPAMEQLAVIDRIAPGVTVVRDAASGATQRRFVLLSDSLTRHTFYLNGPSPLRPHASLSVERLSQLLRLLTRRLLRYRETRRRAVTLALPLSMRINDRGVMLCECDPSETSLASVLHAARSAAGLPPLGPALTHQRTLSRGVAPPDEEARRERLRQAYDDACRGVPDDALLRCVRESLPSLVQQWELRRALTAQLGLHALLSYTLQLKALQPGSVVFSRATGAVHLACAADLTAAGAAAEKPLPFRLTRNLQRLATPFGVDGAFSATFSAAAECFASPRKCPLELWLATLAQPEEDGATGAPLPFSPPWGAAPAEAASRMHALSPAELVKKMGKQADVHANLRALVAEATSEEALTRQPPAWQAWL